MMTMHNFAAADKMPSRNIILNSLKESFFLIWKNKFIFFLLIILQITFLAVFFYINLAYQTKILEHTKAISDYLSQQNFDDASVAASIQQQKNILGEDPLLISRNFNEIVKNFRLYLIYIFLLLVFFISMSWAITCKIIRKIGFRELKNILLKNLAMSSLYLGLIFIFFFSLLSIPLSGVAAESSKLLTKYVPFLVFSIILAYFMFVSISLLHNTELKDIVQKTLKVGIKKGHYILAVYFIGIFLFAVSIILFYYFLEKNLFILLLSMLLIVFSFIFGRIFMVKVVEKLG